MSLLPRLLREFHGIEAEDGEIVVDKHAASVLVVMPDGERHTFWVDIRDMSRLVRALADDINEMKHRLADARQSDHNHTER